MQPDFLDALLIECNHRELHTVIDTTGYAPFDILDRMIPNTDLFLYDLKLMDDEDHQKYTGAPGQPVLENLQRLAERDARIDIRFPVIPGITDHNGNIKQIMDFLLDLDQIRNISLLPYNRLGNEKYERLRMHNRMEDLSAPAREAMDGIKSKFENKGFKVRIGG